MFARRVTEVVEIEDRSQGEVIRVTIRKLSGKTLQKASAMRQSEVAQAAKDAGPDLLEMAQRHAAKLEAEPEKKKEPTLEERERARYLGYDRQTVLQAGIDGWTGTDVKFSQQMVDDLDEQTCDLLHRRIINLSLGDLEFEEARREEGKS